MIIYGDKQEEEPTTVWPDKHTVQSLIELYRGRSDDDRRLRTHDLSFYFRELARKVEVESAKLRKSNHEAKYPMWDPHYDNLSTDGLKHLVVILEAKIHMRLDETLEGNADNILIGHACNDLSWKASNSAMHNAEFV
ncbi:hypothetical protein CQW23_17095 [Capsicum baccatum]|uniref:Uncharacterized protein n=1 Tax=Capsicum baccatum TaxID=33114 RepID=A0A2G2WD80_CAPBA|nr:hypothetical protein CQW23_17095 [Capsicum baccatum]